MLNPTISKEKMLEEYPRFLTLINENGLPITLSNSPLSENYIPPILAYLLSEVDDFINFCKSYKLTVIVEDRFIHINEGITNWIISIPPNRNAKHFTIHHSNFHSTVLSIIPPEWIDKIYHRQHDCKSQTITGVLEYIYDHKFALRERNIKAKDYSKLYNRSNSQKKSKRTRAKEANAKKRQYKRYCICSVLNLLEELEQNTLSETTFSYSG